MKVLVTLILLINCARLFGQINSKALTITSDFDCVAPQLTLFKCDATWLPSWGTSNSFTLITASHNNPNTKGKFIFQLFLVSSEIGYCMNAPAVDAPPNPEFSDTWKDLQFAAGQSGFTEPEDKGQYITIQTMGNPVSSATVKVNSYDYGAIGRIRAYFIPEGGSQDDRVPAIEEGSTTKAYTTIPRDMNENGIADAAPNNLDNGDKTSDDDNLPSGSNTGDGLM